ncbi:hypothetical protein [Cloacibacillus porcorum]|nr:hypothetical protein [Cloacibacillus porcorum]MDY5390010.1 hypothetical protein [Cloacibacillus porcorum]
MKKFFAAALLVSMIFVSSAAMAGEKLTVYTSMKGLPHRSFEG